MTTPDFHSEALAFCREHNSLDVSLVAAAMERGYIMCINHNIEKVRKALEDLQKFREESNRQH